MKPKTANKLNDLRGLKNFSSSTLPPRRGIALVITLLMLSIITFLAVAFLVVTRGQRAAATVVLDSTSAKAMSQAAIARAQSEIISHMLPPFTLSGDVLNYDFMESVNYISTNYTSGGGLNTGNVNYDLAAAYGPVEIAQNIANLYTDPRVPIFRQTNLNLPNALDFPFWVDLNHNGLFETNGYQPLTGPTGQTNGLFAYMHGEPEWIGMLEYPEAPHSATNRFIGRYAYLVLPIGKTPDLNYIHNYAKSLQSGFAAPMPPPGTSDVDQYSRDQGVGSWELNLAGLLYNLNTNIWGVYSNSPSYTTPNSGSAFNDAYSFMYFRYHTNSGTSFYGANYPWALNRFSNAASLNLPISGIDEYANPNVTNAAQPWPGGYSTNGYFDIAFSDLFDTNKVSTGLINDLLFASSRPDSYNRYTFQRLLGSLGTGSTPELQTYVYNDGLTVVPGTLPLRPRIKVNVNGDNSYQITNNLNTSPSAFSFWSNNPAGPLAFFTNAAESLIRSQEFPITNTFTNPFTGLLVVGGTNYNHFGLTNIPVYSATNASIRYSENLHRMLQVAANIYDATRPNASPVPYAGGAAPAVLSPHPSVFRPLFATDRTNLYIVGYTTNMANSDALTQIRGGFVDITNTLNLSSNALLNTNVWGIPWVVGAVKGVPEFDRFTSANGWYVERKLLFARYPAANGTNGDYTRAPQYTNQYYCMILTNISGMDAWNTYSNNLYSQSAPGVAGTFLVYASNYITVTLTNNAAGPRAFGQTIGLTNFAFNTITTPWRRFNALTTTNSMLAFLQTNVISLPGNYFSENYGPSMWPLSASNILNQNYVGTNYGSNAFQPNDRMQTILPAYGWTLSVTNHLIYCLMDSSTHQIYDFVNLGPFGTNIVFTNYTNPQNYPGTIGSGRINGGGTANVWDPTMVGNMNQGVLNEINNAVTTVGNTSLFYEELHGTATNLERYFASPVSSPVSTPFVSETWIVNDPLVHYTLGDLTRPNLDTNQVLTQNDRYEPWPSANSTVSQTIGANTTFKDPLLTGSDLWAFPTNLFPNVGWLGRVHRGTPWQTIFLKADSPAQAGNNYQNWTNKWVSTADTYPTGDYALLDLFTATPNDNAASGQVSINETNSAAWYSVLSSLTVPTAGGDFEQIDPTSTNIDYVLNGPFGINNARSLQPNDAFHHLGTLLTSPLLTIGSPFLGTNANYLPDEAVEAIPQQVMGLLKVGYPQFVIYGFGQSLKPKNIYFGAANFNLCTNYQITGEYAVRMVCHVTGSPDASNAKIQVDSYTILPGN
jgi:hypothetical protein